MAAVTLKPCLLCGTLIFLQGTSMGGKSQADLYNTKASFDGLCDNGATIKSKLNC